MAIYEPWVAHTSPERPNVAINGEVKGIPYPALYGAAFMQDEANGAIGKPDESGNELPRASWYNDKQAVSSPSGIRRWDPHRLFPTPPAAH
ncbi:MAG: hypothetical protein Q9208_007579 [Pyrenodesmia sp. 3 TL-2023]